MANAAAKERTDLDLDHFRQILEQERARILDQMRHIDSRDPGSDTANELDELADYDQHMADQATTTFLREQDQAIYVGLRSELDQVEAAAERLEEGRFGICERCEQPISPERLEVLPFTRFCIECAGDVEARF
jgi:RNA polymerase-binding transcription factor DksA